MIAALLLLFFGGPDGPDDVMAFLENALRGRNVPRERMLEVAEHYQHFGGVSPINAQNRELLEALRAELALHVPQLPIYWGNRNWHPYLSDTLRQMTQDGVRHALAIVTSVFSSYSGCRQYREDIIRARELVGPDAPQVDKLRVFYNHPGFIETMMDRVREALEKIPAPRRAAARLIFTAHSIPLAMAAGCDYEKQLHESCRLVCQGLHRDTWQLVYQSRSGPPTQPWLEPDVCDYLVTLRETTDVQDVVLIPIGFVSDHMEVLFDLDTEAHDRCVSLGLHMVRAGTAGTHPRFVSMLRELITERVTTGGQRLAIGEFGPNHDVCPLDCCPSGRPTTGPGGPPVWPPHAAGGGRPASS